MPLHDSRPGARIPIPATLNVNGPGFAGLYAGDVVEFVTRDTPGALRRGKEYRNRTATVLPLLVFPDHVQVRYGPVGYTVDASNFVRLVRRGKRHMAASKTQASIPPRSQVTCPRCGVAHYVGVYACE